MSSVTLFTKWRQYFTKENITTLDIVFFLRQFAALIASNIPIIKSCEILEKSQQKRSLARLVYFIKREILTGKTLFYTLKTQPAYFDEFTCQLIQIGEYTGKLDIVLTTIANEYEKHYFIRQKIKQALFYPSIISAIALFTTFCMFFFVIPKFAELFSDIYDKLPALTVWMFYFSNLLHHYGWLFFLMILLMIFLIHVCLINLKFHLLNLIKKFPYINACLQKLTLARFARNLSMTFSAGLPLTNALNLIATANDNKEFALNVKQIRLHISSGLQLHQAMQSVGGFPGLMVQMVKIGEESGNIDKMLDKTAQFFEAEIDQYISLMSKLLEPLIMIVLGVLIGSLVVGMYLPIFKLGNAL